VLLLDNKVVFCTGGAGTICSAQVRALVHLGANACIIGRNVEKTESMAKNIATARQGAKVIGIGAVDVRKIESLESAVERCVRELGGVRHISFFHVQARALFRSRVSSFVRVSWEPLLSS
jgi:2,4-dienoyl-CoA reductase [(3E)-enoyl-CoA-producing], peroxisomal